MAADKFLRALGRGCPWGTKTRYHKNSVDARLIGCACCWREDYNDIGEFEINRQFKFLPLNKLNILKLNEKDSCTHEKQIRISKYYYQ